MNCPSRTEEPEGTGFNQNPSALAADLTTRQDLNGIANARLLRRVATGEIENVVEHLPDDDIKKTAVIAKMVLASDSHECDECERGMSGFEVVNLSDGDLYERGADGGRSLPISSEWFMRLRAVVLKSAKFVGPGFMVCSLQDSSIVPEGQGMSFVSSCRFINYC